MTRSAAVAACVLALATLAGCSSQASSSDLAAGPAPAPRAAQPVLVEPVAPDLAAKEPVRVRIPSIGVDAAIEPLFLDGNGALPPPASYDGTGWWHDGPEPGEAGPAVIAGHVDSGSGPAVFVDLSRLAPGELIYVDRADDTTAVFVAQRTEAHPKDRFPTKAVYDDTPDSQLRLVTCDGEFDRAASSYDDNIIVYATRTAA